LLSDNRSTGSVPWHHFKLIQLAPAAMAAYPADSTGSCRGCTSSGSNWFLLWLRIQRIQRVDFKYWPILHN
jgi:hypothetical protein